MIDPNVFLQMVAETARRGGRDEVKDLEIVLDAIWRNFDYVGEARMRKVVAMGAGALLTTVSLDHLVQEADDRVIEIVWNVSMVNSVRPLLFDLASCFLRALTTSEHIPRRPRRSPTPLIRLWGTRRKALEGGSSDPMGRN